MVDLGTSLDARRDAPCESCGTPLPVDARFCLSCGTPVVAARTAREVRKTVTLLFTDVTGSTAMGEQFDPEAYRGVMGRYFDVARAAVERHGGTVEKFVGDAVLAVFGVPEVREDDALRAVRAAFDMTRGLTELSDELEHTMDVRLEVRTGVNTGSVVAGASRAGGAFATGDAVNTAARLEQAAPPGQILIGEETYALVRDAVHVEAAEPVAAKGKAQPLTAYRLLEVHESEHGRRRRQDTQLVGRDRESRVLVDALDRTLETGRGHLVTVVGGPGIGKTRLVSEFLATVGDRADVISGRCVSYGQGITYWPVVQLLRQALGLAGGESDEVTRHALDLLMAGSVDGDQVCSLLFPLLGRGGEPGGTDQTFWAVRRALEQLATRHPLVVTVDDLHWAEPTLLELIEQLRDEIRDLPLLLVCQARPELLDDHPGWGGGALNSMTFGLEPFSTQQTVDSLAALLGDAVDSTLGATVADWAGGNPLFVEEVAAHLVNRDLIQLTPDGWILVGDLSEANVPPTVAALLAARLDRLPERERRLVERLSVVGLEVTADDAAVLADGVLDPAEVSEALAALAHRDLLQRQRTDKGETWAFRHILVREAAYESLPKALRAELHERFADRMAEMGDEVGSERLAFVGHHLEAAVRFRRELALHDPHLPALTDRTARTLADAATDARAREDVPAAMKLLRRALALDLPSTAVRRDLLLHLAQTMVDEEQVAELGEVLTEFEHAVDETATELDRAALGTLRLHQRMSASEPVAPEDLATSARELVRLARDAHHPRLHTLGLIALANCSMMAGRWAEAAAAITEMEIVGSAHDLRFVRLIDSAVVVYGPQPMSALDDIVAQGRRAGGHSPGEVLRLQATEAIAAAALGRPDAVTLIERVAEQSDAGFVAVYRMLLVGVARALLGDLPGAIEAFDHTVQAMLDSGDLSHGSTQLAWRAMLKLEVGRRRRGGPRDRAGGRGHLALRRHVGGPGRGGPRSGCLRPRRPRRGPSPGRGGGADGGPQRPEVAAGRRTPLGRTGCPAARRRRGRASVARRGVGALPGQGDGALDAGRRGAARRAQRAPVSPSAWLPESRWAR